MKLETALLGLLLLLSATLLSLTRARLRGDCRDIFIGNCN